MNTNYFFSIILPVYNGEEYLAKAIESILSQSLTNFELIIIDDASTDSSPEITKYFQNKDPRIRFIQNSENLSLPESLNIGHNISQGDFVTWTSHDNILKPDFLLSFYNEIGSEDFDVLFSNYDLIDADGEIKRKHIAGPVNFLPLGNFIGASFLYKREVFEELNGFNSNLFLVEDHDFFLRAALKFNFHHVAKNLYQYRLHGNSLTSKIQNDMDFAEKLKFGLYRMYDELEIRLHHSTIDLIIGLYFKEPILDLYLKKKSEIRNDFLIFENKISVHSKKQLLDHLEYLLRLNWLSHNSYHTLYTLFKVVTKTPELLFKASHNKNASLKIISLSFSKLFS